MDIPNNVIKRDCSVWLIMSIKTIWDKLFRSPCYYGTVELFLIFFKLAEINVRKNGEPQLGRSLEGQRLEHMDLNYYLLLHLQTGEEEEKPTSRYIRDASLCSKCSSKLTVTRTNVVIQPKQVWGVLCIFLLNVLQDPMHGMEKMVKTSLEFASAKFEGFYINTNQ